MRGMQWLVLSLGAVLLWLVPQAAQAAGGVTVPALPTRCDFYTNARVQTAYGYTGMVYSAGSNAALCQFNNTEQSPQAASVTQTFNTPPGYPDSVAGQPMTAQSFAGWPAGAELRLVAANASVAGNTHCPPSPVQFTVRRNGAQAFSTSSIACDPGQSRNDLIVPAGQLGSSDWLVFEYAGPGNALFWFSVGSETVTPPQPTRPGEFRVTGGTAECDGTSPRNVIRWEPASAGATRYLIKRNGAYYYETWDFGDVSAMTSFTDRAELGPVSVTGLPGPEEGMTYTYEIIAINSAGQRSGGTAQVQTSVCRGGTERLDVRIVPLETTLRRGNTSNPLAPDAGTYGYLKTEVYDQEGKLVNWATCALCFLGPEAVDGFTYSWSQEGVDIRLQDGILAPGIAKTVYSGTELGTATVRVDVEWKGLRGSGTARVRVTDEPAQTSWFTARSTCADTTPRNTLTWQWNGELTVGGPVQVGSGERTYRLYKRVNRPGSPADQLTEIAAVTSRDGRGEYQDADVAVGTAYLYQIRVDGEILSTASSEVTTTGCVPAGEEGISVTPSAVSLSRDASQVFTVSLSGVPADVAESVVYSWDLQDSSLGRISPLASDPRRATLVVSSSAELRRYDNVVRVTARVNDRALVDAATVAVVAGGGGGGGGGMGRARILGDIFAGGNLANISVDVNAVVSAKGTIENVNSQNLIQDYSRDTVEETGALLNKIVAERAVELPSTTSGQTQVSGRFNLNPKTRGNPSDSTTSAANPEGGVWYVRGDLVLSDVQFFGRGTIVVDGNVRFEGSTGVHYADQNSLLGVIARGGPEANGDINVSGVQSVVGAYYAPNGTITIGEGVTVPQGLFVGESIVLGAKDISVTYDSRITKNPPLGFSASFTPSISEVTP